MIRRLRDRDEAGMADLLLHFGPLMRYIIAPILPNPQDREDCLSEVTLRIWEKIDQFDPRRGSWNAWLTAITRNTALNHRRAAQAHCGAEVLSQDTPASSLTTAQIAAELGMTERAVEGRLYRLKKQLRKMLGGENHG